MVFTTPASYLGECTRPRMSPAPQKQQADSVLRQEGDHARVDVKPGQRDTMVLQQVTKVLSALSFVPRDGVTSSCNRAAEVLLTHVQEVDTVSLCTYTAGVPSVCLLAGAAGHGTQLLQQQLVMSGSNWAPYLCAVSGAQFLYRTVAAPEDAEALPQDWAALHEVAGLRTFLAAQVAVPGQGVVGVLCLASRSRGAFMEGSWGPLLSMAATGLVPCLTSPWLGGLSGLAAGLADVASVDGFSGFAARFLQGAGQLLCGVTNSQLGVRLGLLGEPGEELLLLGQPSEEGPSSGTGQQHGSDLLAPTGETAAGSQLLRTSSCCSSSLSESSLPQLHVTRLAAAGTLLQQAVHSSQPCTVLDVQAVVEADRDAVPMDVLLTDASEHVGSMLVAPLLSGGGRALGGLYLLHDQPGALLDGVRLREQVAVLQQLLQQEIADMEVGLEEVQCKSHLVRSVSCLSSSSCSSGVSCAGSYSSVASCASRSAELGVLHKQWKMQDKQQACASSYLSELQLHSVLGEGGFGKVYAGTWLGAPTAAKVMRVSPDDKLGIPAKSAMEMAALSTLRHPNIVTCYACLTDMVPEQRQPALDVSSSSGSSSSSLSQQQGLLGIRFHPAADSDLAGSATDSFNILVMERCDRGNLADAVCAEGLLHRRGPDGVLRVSMGLLYTVLLDVAAALRYMHSMRLVHLDVKASNVLLQTTAGRPGGFPIAKLGDFGLVKLLGKAGSLVNRSTSGTLTHLAPERLQAGSLITPAADAYSFGVLMFELYTAQQPYSGLEPGPALMRAVYHGLRPRLPDSTPPGYRALAEACWGRHIQQRPSFDDIVARLQELLDQTCPPRARR